MKEMIASFLASALLVLSALAGNDFKKTSPAKPIMDDGIERRALALVDGMFRPSTKHYC